MEFNQFGSDQADSNLLNSNFSLIPNRLVSFGFISVSSIPISLVPISLISISLAPPSLVPFGLIWIPKSLATSLFFQSARYQRSPSIYPGLCGLRAPKPGRSLAGCAGGPISISALGLTKRFGERKNQTATMTHMGALHFYRDTCHNVLCSAYRRSLKRRRLHKSSFSGCNYAS